MRDEYDDPLDPQLRAKFYREGKVVFLATRRETALLKSITSDDIRLGAISRRKGLKNAVIRKYLMLSGIIKAVFLSVYSKEAAGIFDFFAINKRDIRNIDEKKTQNGKTTLTFFKKTVKENS